MSDSVSSFYCYENMANRSRTSSSSESPCNYPPVEVSFLDLAFLEDPASKGESSQCRKLRTLRQRKRVERPRTAGKNKTSATVSDTRTSTDGSVNSDVDFQDWSFNSSSTSLVSTSSASSGNISPRSTSPVYESPPPITPAYLRYYRAESKRANEHFFGSVASRGTDIAREARWEARILDLQRRQEAERTEQERAEREASARKVGFWKPRRSS